MASFKSLFPFLFLNNDTVICKVVSHQLFQAFNFPRSVCSPVWPFFHQCPQIHTLQACPLGRHITKWLQIDCDSKMASGIFRKQINKISCYDWLFCFTTVLLKLSSEDLPSWLVLAGADWVFQSWTFLDELYGLYTYFPTNVLSQFLLADHAWTNKDFFLKLEELLFWKLVEGGF